MATITQTVYEMFGMCINFSTGKTEAVIRFPGAGSELAKANCLAIFRLVLKFVAEWRAALIPDFRIFNLIQLNSFPGLINFLKPMVVSCWSP